MSIVILSAVRTPTGAFGKSLAKVSATALGSTAIKAAIERAALKPEQIQEIFMGNVLSANLGQSPARQVYTTTWPSLGCYWRWVSAWNGSYDHQQGLCFWLEKRTFGCHSHYGWKSQVDGCWGNGKITFALFESSRNPCRMSHSIFQGTRLMANNKFQNGHNG